MGTPVILLMFGERYVPVAVALFIVSNMLHFTLGLKLLQPQASLLKVSVNPMTISMIFAIVGAIYHVQLPEPVMQVIDMGGKAVIPLMLFALGVTLYRTKLASLRDGLLGGLLCPIAGILVAEVFCWWMPLPPLQRMMLFSFAALPPALMNYMLAQVYDQAPNKVAAIVLVGHWVSIIMMPVGVWLGGYRG
jgi:predicted permease